MTEFLTTTGISNQLEQIIKGANERLVIISPYLKTNPLIRELLEEKNRWKIDIRVVYGKEDLQPGERAWLDSMASIRTSSCRNLHAKCYLNENRALLTSMNLYEFSQMNNREMGLLVERENDPETYRKIYEEVQRIIRASDDENRAPGGRPVGPGAGHQVTQEPRPAQGRKAAPADAPGTGSSPGPGPDPWGHCIRCREDIPFNPRQPYCRTCFARWKQNDNGSYRKEEKHCHRCGRNHGTTMSRPLCQTCFAGRPSQPAPGS